MTSSNIKTLIIGCGNIAGGFDINKSEWPSTHIGAYKHHGKFDINACVEPNKKIRAEFASRWNINNAFSTIQEVIANGLNFDVISICSSTCSHHINVFEALKLKPKVIFCEKPLASSYKDALEIIEMCKNNNIKLAVNYSRRWDPKVVELRNEIASGKFGEISSIVCYYNKGVLNNGSHMVDLLLNLLGSLQIVTAISPINDYSIDDPTLSALLKTNTGLPIHLVATNAHEYSLFELEIFGSKKSIKMRDGGLNWSSRTIIKDSRFEGYKNLSKDQYTEGRYQEAMTRAVENIYNVIKYDEELLCTGQEAFEAHKICYDLKEIALLDKDCR